MLFNSIEFLLFLPVVFGLYWLVVVRSLRAQNLFVLLASYVFYGWWDWRFLGLILLSTAVDYLIGLGMLRLNATAHRRLLLALSLAVNLGLLGFFKYWNFFVDSWIAAWSSLGVSLHPATVQIVLPVGISFYTFQTLSYAIDVYRRRVEPTRDPVAFAAFVAFFPQLVAGPIERATRLLPQFLQPRVFSYSDAVEGLRQILWGMFKKIVIADQLAVHVDAIFADPGAQSSQVLALGAVFFAFQIYCDFSGYSDIAIGTARLFGFNLMTNFRYPYFARDIAEFWRRWHISLSSWFRDYLYIPLGGSRGSVAITLRNVTLVFLLSGLWHGANWTFIAWGALHAACFLPLILRGRHRRHLDDAAAGRLWPSLRETGAMLTTFTVVSVAWVFFRSPDLPAAFAYLRQLLAFTATGAIETASLLPALALVMALVIVEWPARMRSFPLSHPRWPVPLRWGVYFGLLYWIVIVSRRTTEFIYFQF